MSLWFTEKHTAHTGLTMEVRKSLYHGKSDFQTLEILDTFEYGKVFLLDGAVMLTQRDEFIYHEMLAHVPLLTHPDPRKVLVVGGGDGGTVREVLKHKGVEEVTLVEIDRKVVEVCREHLPEVSCGLDDNRVTIRFEDGVRFVDEADEGSFDVILVDSTDPVGPAVALFSVRFFEACSRSLGKNGVFACQSESPFFDLPFMKDIHGHATGAFARARFYLAPVTTYPGGCWSFLMGTRNAVDFPLCREDTGIPTRYYTQQVHLASFALPRFLEEALRG